MLMKMFAGCGREARSRGGSKRLMIAFASLAAAAAAQGGETLLCRNTARGMIALMSTNNL